MTKVTLGGDGRADRIEVSGCYDDGGGCPFFDAEDMYCVHPRAGTSGRLIAGLYPRKYPAWCYLIGNVTMVSGPVPEENEST